MMWTPRISPYFSSATTLTNPSCVPRMVALLFASERKLADLHFVARRARLRFGQAHAADARLGVSAPGNAVAIDGRGRLARHVRHRDHALPRGHMRQLRRSRHHVADGVNPGLAGLLVLVHLDEAAIELRPWCSPGRCSRCSARGPRRPAVSRLRPLPLCRSRA